MQGYDATEHSSGLGQPGLHHLPPGGGWSPDSSGKQRMAARRFIEARVRVFSSEEVLRTRGSESQQQCGFSGRRRLSDDIERCRVSRGTKSSGTSRSGEAPTPSRGGSRHVPDSTVPHGSARRRMAALRRPGDARRPRGGSLCPRRSQSVRRLAATSGASTGRPTVTASSR